MLGMTIHRVAVPEETRHVSIEEINNRVESYYLFNPPSVTFGIHKDWNSGFSTRPDSFSTIIARAFF